jgi:putative protein-disulfide isomerase
MSSSQFYYVHDPMCSWCWAYRPVWQDFEKALTEIVSIYYLVGGLAPDTDAAMPQKQQDDIKAIWRHIQTTLGTPFNFDFWTKSTPRRSTYPACRAVIAARWQHAERAMIQAVQEAYYQRALNPSDTAVHLQLASELGLDVDQYQHDLNSQRLAQTFQHELALAHRLPIQGFPSMVLVHQQRAYEVPLDYQDFATGLAFVEGILKAGSHEH